MLEAPQPRIHLEAHSTLAPFAELGEHIFRDESDLRMPADELELLRIPLGRNESDVGRAVGRRDGDEIFIASVKDELETELVHVELEAPIQVANVDADRLQTQVRVPAVQANRRPVQPFVRRASHGPALYDGAIGAALQAAVLLFS